ncbi:BRO1 domain-containing protein BROX-like [Rhopilema esculentum]|uniref:BRO1 domain-containing protein BROX-like n=1 Tax=Rhopilema esculentum TaxID=499914 RepID=UPI0031D6FAB9|eukprot:gene3192-1506_t
MAHWFHRNPLKSASPVSFDALKLITTNKSTQKICGDLKTTRARFLTALTDPGNSIATIEAAANQYISLLQGLCCDVGGQGESQLKNCVNFKWTNSIGGNEICEMPDGHFELVSILCEMGLWFMKHASKMAANDSVTDDEAKEIHRSLRTAAGIFQQVKDISASRLGAGSLPKHADTDPRILDAYILQCLGEAQEVTVARSVELKHKPTITSAVANETSKLFDKAGANLKTIDQGKVAKWRKYLQLKKDIYLAYAHAFVGESELNEDQCGKAIRSLKEGEKYYQSAARLCKEYASTRGPGTTAKPGEHLFFKRLGPIISKRLDKATHENGFIYHQKVPAEPTELESTPQYGVASPVEFPIPAPAPVWTADFLAGFQVSKSQPKAHGTDAEVEQIKEPEINPKSSGNKSETGCIVS